MTLNSLWTGVPKLYELQRVLEDKDACGGEGEGDSPSLDWTQPLRPLLIHASSPRWRRMAGCGEEVKYVVVLLRFQTSIALPSVLGGVPVTNKAQQFRVLCPPPSLRRDADAYICGTKAHEVSVLEPQKDQELAMSSPRSSPTTRSLSYILKCQHSALTLPTSHLYTSATWT
ncbi:hypothetical protein BDZ89DRAFT_1224143 [Hymenopellis radicata]|nr:hypothetical protein BDZ89DRAFT_1224143 [Hymenopellis radicata]